MSDSLPKDCDWIICGNFNMTERAQDKSNDCGRAISDLERLTWNGLLNAFQLHDAYIHQGDPRFSWHNGQIGRARRLARLDRFYIPTHSRIGLKHSSYFIHGYSVGSNHSPIQMEICMGEEGARRSSFKWNISHLKGEMVGTLRERWSSLPEESPFFQKLRNVTRLYRHLSKLKAKEFRKEELDARAKLEIAIASLHEDIYNMEKQGEVSRLNNILEEIVTWKARGATIRTRVKWQQFGDKCSAEFFKSVRQKNSQTVLSELRDKHGRCFTRKEDLDRICYDFYKDLYAHKVVSEGALEEVFEGFQAPFTGAMNDSLTKEITERELGAVVRDMAMGKAPGHDGIPIEFFQKLWPTIGQDFHLMLIRSIERGVLHEGITKGIISLIPKEGDAKDLNY